MTDEGRLHYYDITIIAYFDPENVVRPTSLPTLCREIHPTHTVSHLCAADPVT
jgi:hypothetical protein